MGSVYIIHFIESGIEEAYTTVTALCEAYEHHEIKISRERLSVNLKKNNIYENRKVIIKKFKPLTAKEVREKKENI